jgi:hypothetical protein
MDWFNKPAIASIFNPVVGNGALYQTEHQGQKDSSELTVVGKETVNGQEAFWLETNHVDQKGAVMSYEKILITKNDLQFHRLVTQRPGQQPIEVPFTPSARTKSQLNQTLDKWHKVGSESITVPAGTFSCDHWKKDGGQDDLWVNSKISPVGVVKEVSSGRSTVLVKVMTDAKDHIAGTPQKLDPDAMRRQMMEQMQKQKK